MALRTTFSIAETTDATYLQILSYGHVSTVTAPSSLFRTVPYPTHPLQAS